MEKEVTVYDALFLSLAKKLDVKLITTDGKLYNRVKGTELRKFIHMIANLTKSILQLIYIV